MPLETQKITLPFVKGQETKLDPKLVQDGHLLSLTNASFAEDGTPTRRDAWVSQSGNSPVSPKAMCAYGDEMLTVAGETLYSYSPTKANHYAKGTVSPCSLSRKSVLAGTSFVDRNDAAYAAGYICHIWTDTVISAGGGAATTTGVYAQVFDETTGASLYGPTQVTSGGAGTPVASRVVALTATSPSNRAAFVITWTNSADTDLQCVAIDLTNMTLTSRLTIVAGTTSTLVDCVSMGGTLVALYTSNFLGTDSTSAVMVQHVSGTLSMISGPITCSLQAAIPRADVVGLAIASYTSGIIGVFALGVAGANQGVWAGTLNATATTITAGVAMANVDAAQAPTAGAYSSITATLVSSKMLVFSDDNSGMSQGGAGGTTALLRSVGLNSSNAVTQSPATVLNSFTYASGACGPYIAGKAFTKNFKAYLPIYVGSAVVGEPNLQCSWFLYSESSGKIVGRALYGTFGFWTVANDRPYMKGPPSSLTLADGRILCPALERGQLAFGGGNNINVTPVGLSNLYLDFDPTFSTAQVGPCQFFAGGMLTQYDGRSVVEAGFHLFPEYVRTQLTGTGLTGTYQYCALYEWVDNQGQRHQSAPSVPVTASPVNQTVRINVASLGMTAKTGVSVVIYRTVTLGTTFYRLTDTTHRVANATTAMTANYDDSATDASIQDNEILYTVGGELDHTGPTFVGAIAAHQDRLWMVGLEDPTEFRFSQAVAKSDGLSFNEALSGRIPQGIGGLTAVGVVDDKAILFTETRKLVVFGDGPTSAGAQGTYSNPQLLPSDVGCSEPRSLAATPGGLVYQSAHGLFLLNRALQDENIGSPIDGVLLDYAITSAVVLEDKSQVRFTVKISDSSSVVLVYDIQFGTWSTFSSARSLGLVSACVWNGTYVLLDSWSEVVLVDTPGTYLDIGSNVIPVTIVTPWINLGQLSGFERVKRLILNGSYGANSTITIAVAVDYDNTVAYTATLTASSTARVAAVLQLRHHIARQKCQAIRFTITDTPVTSAYSGCNFSGITLELGMKKGSAKLPAANST